MGHKLSLEERIRSYENQTTGIKMIPRIPLVVRLDGEKFSRFTKSLAKPYDERLSKLMQETTKYLISLSNATIGYTGSDEITLIFYVEDNKENDMFYDGKLYKILSKLAAKASVFFNSKLSEYLPEKVNYSPLPIFDCRVFNVPDLVEAVNVLKWRENDTTRNSISMAAQSVYSQNKLHGKNKSELMDLLMEKNINWNDYPSFYKKGSYFKKKQVQLTTNQNGEEISYIRNVVQEIEIPPLSQLDFEEIINIFFK